MSYDKPPKSPEKININYNYPGPHAWRKIIAERYPLLRFNGIFAKRKVAGTNTPSAHQVARGIDQSVDSPAAKAQADQLVAWLISVADKVGIQGVIFNHRIWGFGKNYWRNTHPDGNPHIDHVHGEWDVAGASLTEPQIRSLIQDQPQPEPTIPVTYVQGKDNEDMPATSMSVHREDGRVDKVVIGANVDGSPNQRVYHGFSDDGIKFGWQEIDSGGRALWIDDLYWRGNQLIACVHGTDHCLYSASSKATGWNGFQRAGDKDNRVAVPPGVS